jgi:tripartite-type tricarboxylate transporter receptor subunit TctC
VVGLINKSLAFDPVKDFVAVTQVASTPLVMIVPPESPAKSVKDIIEMAKAAPGKLNYASAGPGSTTGLAGALFIKATQINMVPVSFKGLPETHTAVIRGDVAWGFTFPAGGGDLIQSGKVRALAVTAAKRLAALPDVPTLREAGVPEFDHEPWFGILAPAGVPKEILAKASQAIGEVLAIPDVKARFEPQGTLLVSNTPDRFDEIVKGDAARFAPLFGAEK